MHVQLDKCIDSSCFYFTLWFLSAHLRSYEIFIIPVPIRIKMTINITMRTKQWANLYKGVSMTWNYGERIIGRSVISTYYQSKEHHTLSVRLVLDSSRRGAVAGLKSCPDSAVILTKILGRGINFSGNIIPHLLPKRKIESCAFRSLQEEKVPWLTTVSKNYSTLNNLTQTDQITAFQCAS